MIPPGSIKDTSFGEDVPSDRRVGVSQGGPGHAPEIAWDEYVLRCNLVHFETQFWEILRYRVCIDLSDIWQLFLEPEWALSQ